VCSDQEEETFGLDYFVLFFLILIVFVIFVINFFVRFRVNN